MNKRKNWIIIVLLALSIGLLLAINASAQKSAVWQQLCYGRVSIEDQGNGLLVSCFGDSEPTPEPGPTDTPLPDPTKTPAPEPNSTPPAQPTVTPAGLVDPYPEAPACATHDNRAYHGLWDSSRGCHYNHTHNDDPHLVDDIFGTDFYKWAGGEISYPWQTASAAGTENDVKHGGYGWLVRRDLPCDSEFTDGCITAFRALYHGIGSNHGAYTRYHSYWLEAQVCREDAPTDCGIVRVGGWQDSGDLMVDNITILDEPDNVNRFKLHYSGEHQPDGIGNENYATWYSASQESWAQVAVQFEDMWGLINRDGDAGELHLFCDDLSRCSNNGSRVQPHVIGAGVRNRYIALVDPDGDGYADFNGFVDRYGLPVTGCSQIDLDCIPLVLEQVPLGTLYQFRGGAREYDIYFDGKPSGWIDYPN